MEGERIAQMIIEKIDMSDAMEVDKLGDIIQDKEGVGSTNLSPKRLVQATDTPPVVCILQANHHQQKNLLLRTDRARFLTNSVRSLRPVLPDLPCLLCLSFLASGAPGRPTFPPQRPTRLLRPHPLLVPPPCIPPLSSRLLASGLLLAFARVRRPSLLPSHLWRPRSVRFHPRPSAAILRHFFLSRHPTVISIIPLLFTRRPVRPPCRPPTLVGFPSHRRA